MLENSLGNLIFPFYSIFFLFLAKHILKILYAFTKKLRGNQVLYVGVAYLFIVKVSIFIIL